MIKNHLRIVVLKALCEQNLSGYDLIRTIYTSTGCWKPSYGSIYPLLKELHATRLVESKDVGRRKVYSITGKGRHALNDMIAATGNIQRAIAKECKMMESVCSPTEKKFVQYISTQFQNHGAIFGSVTDEVDRLQRVMMHLISNGRIVKNEQKIKEILNDAVKKLKKLESP